MQLQDLLTIVCTAVKPELVTPLVNTTLAQGDSHMFVCAAVADPRPVFTFRFNGERITSTNSKYTLVTNNTHGALTVFNIQGNDEGTYTCSASNRYGSVSTAAILTVQGVFGFECVYRKSIYTIDSWPWANIVCLICPDTETLNDILTLSQFLPHLLSPLLLSVML